MASPGGTSSNTSCFQQNSSSEEDLQLQMVDERKRKRMLSNRESARRSRMRKQKHLDDLMAQAVNLKKSNSQIINSINVTTQHFLMFEAENSVLRAQMTELSNRLQSLNVINNAINHDYSHHHNHGLGIYGDELLFPIVEDDFGHDNSYIMDPWDAAASYMNQPIIASADMFQS